MRYAVIIEKDGRACSAYVPDLPGCVAAAASRKEVLGLIPEAIEFHLEGMREEGLPSPSRAPAPKTSKSPRRERDLGL